MNILVTGATGLIGKALCQVLLADGHQVSAFSRRPPTDTQLPNAATADAAGNRVRFHAWEPLQGAPPANALVGVDAVIHLAGEPVVGRWTEARKQSIRASRVIGTRNLVAGMLAAAQPPRVLLCASAVGFYGDRDDELLPETAAPGTGFLAEVCQAWEAETEPARANGLRVVNVRIGAVLSPEGGALETMLPAFRVGIAGKLASGRQWFPWIHLADIVGIFRHALEQPGIHGLLNGVAPEPVTNEEFTKELAAVLNRPALLPAPEFALKLLFGEMATVVLASQRVQPVATLASGYQYRFPQLRAALLDLLGA